MCQRVPSSSSRPSGVKPPPTSCAQRLLDRVVLRLEPGERQFRRQRGGKAAHAAGDVERRRAGDGVGVARRQHQRRRDAHGAADPGRIETAQARARRGRRQQRHLAVLMRQRPRREPAGEPGRDIVAEHEAPSASRGPGCPPARRPPARRAAPASPPGRRRSAAPRTARSPARRCRSAAPRCADLCRPAARIDRGAAAGSRREPLAQLPHLGPLRAGEDHAERVEQHQLGVPLHRLGDVLPLRPATNCASSSICRPLRRPSKFLTKVCRVIELRACL